LRFEDARGVIEIEVIGKSDLGKADGSEREFLAKGVQEGRKVVTTQLQEGLGVG
jgi:hypothetical protein